MIHLQIALKRAELAWLDVRIAAAWGAYYGRLYARMLVLRTQLACLRTIRLAFGNIPWGA